MRRILHLSDLHFGRIDPAVLAALEAGVAALAPHLVAVSGDLTQRARPREFQAARRFLASLPAPCLAVPGNHDVPLYDVATRFAAPLGRWRRWFAREVEPVFEDEEIVVVGLNSARSLTFKGGRINRQQARRALATFRRAPERRVRVLVSHHPFDLPGDAAAERDADRVGRADLALSLLRPCAPDLLLAGHFHRQGAGPLPERVAHGVRGAILVQAGSATSTRLRGSANAFNLLHVEAHAVRIEHFEWAAAPGRFEAASTACFVRRGGAWARATADD